MGLTGSSVFYKMDFIHMYVGQTPNKTPSLMMKQTLWCGEVDVEYVKDCVHFFSESVNFIQGLDMLFLYLIALYTFLS